MTAFLDYLQFQARSRPQFPALMTVRANLSYQELVDRARGVGRYFADNKLQSGDILAVTLVDPIAHVSVIVAAMACGISTLSVVGHRPSLPSKLNVKAILTDHPVQVPDEIRVLRIA